MRATLALVPGGTAVSVPEDARPPFACPEALTKGASDKPGARFRTDCFAGPETLTKGASPPVASAEGELPVLRLARCDLYLLVCGVGPVAAALSLGACLGGFRRIARRTLPDGVINAGLAGSYDLDKAPVGSLLCVEEECFPEYGVRAGEGGAPPALLPLPQLVADAGPVFARLALDPDAALARMSPALGKTSPIRHSDRDAPLCTRGVALTVAGISGDPAFAARMAEHWGGLAENMEGFAAALACASARVPFAEFRAVSNAAGRRPPHTWKISEALAVLSRLGEELFCP
jgi:futalosine hydrolase